MGPNSPPKTIILADKLHGGWRKVKLYDPAGNVNAEERISFNVKIGDQRPEGTSTTTSVPALANPTVFHKQRQCVVPHRHDPRLLTVRYVSTTRQNEQKADRETRQRHIDALAQLKTTLAGAKKAREELEMASEADVHAVTAAGQAVRSLTQKLMVLQATDRLEYTLEKTEKWFLIHVCEPVRLVGVPGSPVIFFYSGDVIKDTEPLEQSIGLRRTVSAVSVLSPIEGRAVKLIALDEKPSHRTCQTVARCKKKGCKATSEKLYVFFLHCPRRTELCSSHLLLF